VTNPPQPATHKPERINIVLKLIVLIMVTVPTAICWIFFFGKPYGTIALIAYFLLMPLLISLLRRRTSTEAESLRRIDKAMGKPSDDPRQMARYLR